jgi:REP element-mobilizing transposase RayT
MGVFQKALAIAKDRFGCGVLQFSILGNHVHFMVEAPGPRLSGAAGGQASRWRGCARGAARVPWAP